MVDVTDRTLRLHVGGKIEVRNKSQLRTRDDLSMAYTPGVARVCLAIRDDRSKAFQYTIKRNTVAVVSDGSAVLGLGDIGPEAAMPVMEGKAMLFKEFGGVDAFPLCLDTKDPDEIVATVKAVAPTFGGINLEDISAPRCFEIEDRLKAELDIPVFHDDQHGTAVVTLAALINSCKLLGRDLASLRVLIVGVGAAGVAVARILVEAGVKTIVGVDSRGALHRGRPDFQDGSMSVQKRWFVELQRRGALGLAGGRDRRHGPVHRPLGPARDGAVRARAHERRRDGVRDGQPDPGRPPEEAARYARVIATGRSDYPNQINNVLCFPGIFRGALDVRAREITDAMKMAAARGIAEIVRDDELRARLHHPLGVQPRRGRGGRRRGRRGGPAHRRLSGRGRRGRLRTRRHGRVPAREALAPASHRRLMWRGQDPAMSPTSRAATNGSTSPARPRHGSPPHGLARRPAPTSAAISVPRPRRPPSRTPRESWIDLRATHGSEDAGGASPEAQWQGPAGTPGFRWQDPGKARATSPVRGPEASGPRLGARPDR